MKTVHLRWIPLLAALVAACGQSGAPDAQPRVEVTVYPARSPTTTPIIGPLSMGTPFPIPVPGAQSNAQKCGLRELPSGAHISSSCSFDEGEDAAVGPMLCRIQRDTCQFRRLVNFTEPGVAFWREEGLARGDEDSLMHPAMVLPLTRLRDLVQQEWGGKYQLMVTEVYDSMGDHDPAQPKMALKYSQHFEGRSIDLVTRPVAMAAYPRLCALALQAGYDWVHNEIDHCHASIKAPSLCAACAP